MNIKRAKEEIKDAIKVYLTKDEYGEYCIGESGQRPIFLIGPPGIGKTAIMEQIARECNVGLVSYTITHHTRQSAVGLPLIEKRKFGGSEYTITEYTMSEIIASVYEKIEATGNQEGILFIDEINCVSETLAATMLQFLQAKSFGSHKVPKGWIIVAAGNPPEYNKSVREFDLVTLDRIRRIEVSEDYAVWKEYAYQNRVHGGILSYLEIKKENFYVVETTVDGVEFVTARGWEDLSRVLLIHEQLGLAVDEAFIHQFVQHGRIAKDFANYLDFYYKYKTEYSIPDILKGQIDTIQMEKIAKAPFDEKLTVIGLVLDQLWGMFRQQAKEDAFLNELFGVLKTLKEIMTAEEVGASVSQQFEMVIDEIEQKRIRLEKKEVLDKDSKSCLLKVTDQLYDYQKVIKEEKIQTGMEAFQRIRELFAQQKASRQEMLDRARQALDYGFEFIEAAFGENQELVIFLTELTMNRYSAEFLADYGCEKYERYQKELLFKDRRSQIKDQMKEIEELLAKI